jgi:hypothetical protein
MSTPLTDKINALTAYANEVTGESDATLSEAVHTLADGYGQGGGDTIWTAIVDGTITEINDKDGVCKSVKSYTFYACKSLTSVILSSATSVGNYAFYSCSNLSSVDLPSATSVGADAFYACSKLSSVDLPSVTSIGNAAFSDCKNLSFINLPSATTLNSSAFANCSALAVVDLPRVASISTYALNGCKALKTLILRKSDAICTLSGTSALVSTPINSGTGYIYVPASLIDKYKVASNWKTFAAQFRALEDYTVDGTITGDLDPNKI